MPDAPHPRARRATRLAAAAPILGLAASALAGGGGTPVATLILEEGGAIPGTKADVASAINSPFVTPAGLLGFTGSTAEGDHFVWVGAGPVLFNSELPGTVTGAESTMGASDGGDFIYSPSSDGEDSVRGPAGLILRGDDLDPVDGQSWITFCSRPQMTASGVAHWVSGVNFDGPGGSSQARVLYRRAGGVISKVYEAGDLVDGQAIAFGSGIQFSYHASPSASHLMVEVLLDTGSSGNDNAIVVDGVIVAQEGTAIPGGGGEAWDNFDAMQINDAGDSVFSGDTDGPTASDEFIAVNGTIVLREGTIVDGVRLGSGVRDAAINDGGTIAFVWSTDDGGEALFRGDASDLAGTAEALLVTGDLVDVTGDGVGDYEVTDFTASATIGPGVTIAADGRVWFNVDAIPAGGGDERELMLLLAPAGTGCAADLDGDLLVGFEDLLALLAAWGDCVACPADLDGDGTVGFEDLLIMLAAWGPCA